MASMSLKPTTRLSTTCLPMRPPASAALGLFFPLVYSGTNYQTGLSQLINDNGDVVGDEQVGGVWHAAIWNAANGVQNLNTLYASQIAAAAPGFVLNAATAINNNYIVGYGTDSSNNTSQIFLISGIIVPEPLNVVAGGHGPDWLAGLRLAETEIAITTPLSRWRESGPGRGRVIQSKGKPPSPSPRRER